MSHEWTVEIHIQPKFAIWMKKKLKLPIRAVGMTMYVMVMVMIDDDNLVWQDSQYWYVSLFHLVSTTYMYLAYWWIVIAHILQQTSY